MRKLIPVCYFSPIIDENLPSGVTYIYDLSGENGRKHLRRRDQSQLTKNVANSQQKNLINKHLRFEIN